MIIMITFGILSSGTAAGERKFTLPWHWLYFKLGIYGPEGIYFLSKAKLQVLGISVFDFRRMTISPFIYCKPWFGY